VPPGLSAMTKLFCQVAILAVCLFARALSGAAVVSPVTTVLIDPSEPGPLQKAAADLAADCNRVFGRPCKVVRDPAQAGPSTLWVALNGRLPKSVQRPEGWERLHIQVVRNPWPGSPATDAVVLTGSDLRGAIYAVYEFSARFLGVDPLYWWTDHAPQRRSQIEIPAEFSLTEGPKLHYRGWFVNDEDLLTGWTPGLADGTGISLATWDHLFEALLRLKGNLVVPGTWIFPYEPQIKAAAERGLVVAQHHVNTLGVDTYKWPADKPYSFSSHPELLLAAWARAVNQYPKNAEILWSIGYRGQGDHPFWTEDKDALSTDEGRARTIQTAMDRQLEIISRSHPHSEAVLVAYGENTDFIQRGLMKIPDGVTVVWTDNGHGMVDVRNIRPGQGLYYHLAMMNRRSDHYSEMVPPKRIRKQLGAAVNAGITRYLLVNTANLRPVVMSVRAVMELSWNPTPWLDPHVDESQRYLMRWCRQEFGEPAAPLVARYYQAYFQAPARYGSQEDDVMGDNLYLNATKELMLALLENRPNSKISLGGSLDFPNVQEAAKFLAKSTGDAEERWTQARLLAAHAKPLVAKDRLDFFQAHIQTQVDLHLHFNRMLHDLSDMVQQPGQAGKVKMLRSAIAECEEASRALRAAEYGKWKGFYSNGDWLLNTAQAHLLESAYLDELEGRAITENPIRRASDRGFAYYMISAYQGTQTVLF
jgi:hypothetical protein